MTVAFRTPSIQKVLLLTYLLAYLLTYLLNAAAAAAATTTTSTTTTTTTTILSGQSTRTSARKTCGQEDHDGRTRGLAQRSFVFGDENM